jgi:hypothetical protein
MNIAVMLGIGAGLGLALWIIARRVDLIPWRTWELSKKELAHENGPALAALQEAAKLGPVVASIRAYHEQIAADFRAQIGDAQLRARVVERRSSDAGVALDAASALVRELRALRDAELARGGSPPAPAPHPPPVRVAPRPTTVGLGRAPDDDSEDSGAWTHEERPSDAEGERTRVGPHPLAAAPTLASMPAVTASSEPARKKGGLS